MSVEDCQVEVRSIEIIACIDAFRPPADLKLSMSSESADNEAFVGVVSESDIFYIILSIVTFERAGVLDR